MFSQESQDLFGSQEEQVNPSGGGSGEQPPPEVSHEEKKETKKTELSGRKEEMDRITNMIAMLIQVQEEGQKKMQEGQKKVEGALQEGQKKMQEDQKKMEAGQHSMERKLEETQRETHSLIGGLEQRMERNRQELQYQTKMMVEELKYEVKEEEKKLEERVQSDIKRSIQETNGKLKAVETEFGRQQQEIQIVLEEKLVRNHAEVEELLETQQEKIRECETGVGELKTQWEENQKKPRPINPTSIIYKADHLLHQKPKKFDGNIQTVHPISFVESLENYLRNFEPNEDNKLAYAKGMVEGNAKAWADLNRNKWKSWEDFKEDFIKQYPSKHKCFNKISEMLQLKL
ncbi:golgin subfamily A member 6-like protein 22 [Photinus pyralis]|uniref:golgin subfamily A member 6-like protein 22 n=1 Tax=Photinus pyralis TaxID=7054 RepID=UPI0012675A38|nr:golgin subfamily A member 6-like protein 22 [Photinus pyralis]